MASKDALVSFASTNYYDGTINYLKGMIPSEETLNISNQQKEIADIRKTQTHLQAILKITRFKNQKVKT